AWERVVLCATRMRTALTNAQKILVFPWVPRGFATARFLSGPTSWTSASLRFSTSGPGRDRARVRVGSRFRAGRFDLSTDRAKNWRRRPVRCRPWVWAGRVETGRAGRGGVDVRRVDGRCRENVRLRRLRREGRTGDPRCGIPSRGGGGPAVREGDLGEFADR